MPFTPVIGDAGNPFGAIAAQQGHWIDTNLATESANIARLNQAEQQRNNWLAQMAQLQREDQQAAVAEQNRREAKAQAMAAAAESKRQFDINTELVKQDQRNRAKQYDFAKNERDTAESKRLAAIENSAEFMAPDVHEAGTNMEKSLAQYTDAERALDTIASTIESKYPGQIKYDSRSKQFVGTYLPLPGEKMTPEQKAKNDTAAAEANAAIAEAKAEFDTAKVMYKSHTDTFNGLMKNGQAYGLQFSKRGNTWGVFSPEHKKFWPGLKPESPKAVTPEETPFTPPHGSVGDILNQQGGGLMGVNFGQVSAPSPKIVATGVGQLPSASLAPAPVAATGAWGSPDPTASPAPSLVPPPQPAPVSAPAPLPSIAAPARAAAKPYTEPIEILRAYRTGRMSKTNARELIKNLFGEDLNIVGPEWDTSQLKDDRRWEWQGANPLGVFGNWKYASPKSPYE